MEQFASLDSLVNLHKRKSVTEPQTATLYRMVLPDHTCPFGVRAKELLTERGFTVEDQILETREDTDRFKQEQGVCTTPRYSWKVSESAGTTSWRPTSARPS